ncbi:acyltransferase [Phlyctema vagabunda]|uniref:Acyltransferase n=1 Tax=Phlyctema vagabunda TaxID=108571 RepID=A0ABR4PIM6_9HELO
MGTPQLHSPVEYESILETGQWNDKQQYTKSTIHSVLSWCLDVIRPAIFTRSGPKKQLGRTAYLDGLRGFAAFLVYWHHHQLWARTEIFADQIFENAYGYDNRFYFACLPVVRTFFTGGHLAVSVFFLISGYVLSAKPLALIYSGEFVKLGDNLASAFFRRWIRLHLPLLGTSFFYMTSWHVFGIWTISPEQKINYSGELWNWYTEFKNFTFVFRTGGDSWFTYNYHSWSIPIEFRGSIIIYTTLLAFSRCTRDMRLLGQAALIFYFMYIADGWFGAMFVAGMLLCELDLLSRNNNLPNFLTMPSLAPYKKLINYGVLLVGLILGGVPSHGRDEEVLRGSPGWHYLSKLKPQAVFDYKWFYLFWAAICVMVASPRIPLLKRFFETRFCQYLGQISFALYLMHGPVLWTLGDRLYAATGWYKQEHTVHTPAWVNIFPLSKGGPMGLELSFLLPHLILLPFTLWLAEVVTKVFDKPSVTFSQWAYRKTLAPST